MTSEGPAVDVKGLVKIYGTRTVVDHVDLTIQPGRICGFLGPNGSGKTTTLRMICGLLTPMAARANALATTSFSSVTRSSGRLDT